MTATTTSHATAGPEDLVVDVVAWDDADAAGLRAEQEAETAVRYGGPDDAPAIDPRSIVVTLVARVGGRPVGTAAVRDVSGTDDRRGRGTTHPAATGEVKRVYVHPDARGRGVAKRLMAELERSARSVGFRRFVLETGTAQPEAMGLYESIGYEPVEKFGDHAAFEEQRCYGKRL
ncbi:GNAT family N-acetyltransferase [Isoptericola sp. 4D.3]|jgi:GNAT superfamily N-acetyltransferase|uniref:GNAT family N-acetyltransferase n=1 Tax=Isoptericola peretonis TaxID=2918523 RepID=A0ABT0J9D5_9MICO|nr:GNAT family N-acetyltransferase [Isoptericola sp. 4D.3]